MTKKRPLLIKIYRSKRKCNRKKVLTVTDRERSILEYRFGLIDGKQHTLAEVGSQFNVTRERIRQIEAGALRKIGCYKKRYTRSLSSHFIKNKIYENQN